MKSKQAGTTLIEIIGALAIGAMMTVSLAALVDAMLQDTKAQQAALHQSQVVDAAAKYIKANYGQLAATATSNVPVAITINTLAEDAYLPAGFANANPYGQIPCVLVLQRQEKKLDALVVTEQGADIPDNEIGYVAANAGQGGGYLPSDKLRFPAKSAVGAFNSWMLPPEQLAKFLSKSCSGTTATARHLATALFYDGPGQLSTDFLYRDAQPGHPELNRMNTPLHMYSKAVEGTSIADSASDLRCIDTDPDTFGKIAVDAEGLVLSCQKGVWKRQPGVATLGSWKDPVATYANLVALPAEKNVDGEVRLVLALHRAFAWNAGIAQWVALAIDQNGNLAIPNRLTTGDIAVNRVVALNRDCTSDPAGTVARDATGLILSCQSGTWQSLGAINLAQSNYGCELILPSKYNLPSPCPRHTGRKNWNGSADTWDASVVRQITPSKNGLLAVNVWSQMNRGIVCDCSDPSALSGQLAIVLDIIDNDTNIQIGHSQVRSMKLTNDAATINLSLTKAVAKNTSGYIVKIYTLWTTFDGGAALPDEASFKNWDGTVVQTTPLTTGWNIDLFQ